ncbi:MAG: hypothetical protein OEX05_03665 [Chloroflexota bacterium]|nr:hypothetical protein [Chloroflexota bacterium]
MTRRPDRHGRLRPIVLVAVSLAVVIGMSGIIAVATNTMGAGDRWGSVLARVDRFLAGPVPDRVTLGTVRVTEPPAAPVTPPPVVTEVPDAASADPGPTAEPSTAPAATPTPTPEPVRRPTDVAIDTDPESIFVSQAHKDWCAVAGTQMVLAALGLVDTSRATQNEIAGGIRGWESRQDSRNGGWGPAAMALALDDYGAPGYEIRGFETRQGALRDAARTIQATESPVILLAWRGAHTWVMTGFRADADPTVFRDAHIDGAYILDPWYPRVSSIWGRSDPAGTFQDEAEMTRNFLRWRRPEGRYPDRDGLYITVAPTIPVNPS